MLVLEDDVSANGRLDDVDAARAELKGGVVDKGLAAVTDEAFALMYADTFDALAESTEEALPTKLAGLLVGTVEKVVGVFAGVFVGDDQKA